jgi:hypothetical protein
LPLSDDQPASPRVFGADRAGVFVRTPALKLMVPHLGRVGQSRRLVEVEGGGYAPELEDVSAGRPDDLARLEAELAAWRAQASSKSGDQAAVNGER